MQAPKIAKGSLYKAMGHSMSNQHEKWTLLFDFSEIWYTCSIPQVIQSQQKVAPEVVWLRGYSCPNFAFSLQFSSRVCYKTEHNFFCDHFSEKTITWSWSIFNTLSNDTSQVPFLSRKGERSLMHSFVNEFFLRFFAYKYIRYWSLYDSNLVVGWPWATEHNMNNGRHFKSAPIRASVDLSMLKATLCKLKTWSTTSRSGLMFSFICALSTEYVCPSS